MNCVAFVTDVETRVSLEALVSNYWSSGIVLEGGSKAALLYTPSKDIKYVIVDVSDAKNIKTTCDLILAKFSGAQGVLFIGQANDVALYRDLIRAGAADYVVKPINSEEIYTSLITSSKHQTPTQSSASVSNKKQAKLITVIGARGGAGTTSLVVNAGWILANTHKQNVVLIDMDVHFGTISLALDAKPSIGFKDALQDPSRVDIQFIEGALVKVTPTLSILAAEESMRDYVVFNDNSTKLLIETLKENKDYIIIDTPRSSLVRCPQLMMDADYVVLVSELTVPSLRDTVTILNQIKRIAAHKNIIVVANKARPGITSGQLSIKDFESQIDTKIAIVLPNAPEVIEKALNDGKAAAILAPKSKVIGEINSFCDIIHNKSKELDTEQQSKSIKGFLGRFK